MNKEEMKEYEGIVFFYYKGVGFRGVVHEGVCYEVRTISVFSGLSTTLYEMPNNQIHNIKNVTEDSDKPPSELENSVLEALQNKQDSVNVNIPIDFKKRE